jgi:hypothetical protein
MSVKNVTVNLRVEADASANVEVFGHGPESATYEVIEVVGANTLSAATLSGLIEFWEPSDNRGTRLAALTSGAATFKSALKGQLSNIIDGTADSLDAHLAAPFSASGYNQVEYNHYDSFGEVALAYIAHHMFGHVQATAAITNDTAIVEGINGDGASDARIAEQLASKMTSSATAADYDPTKCLYIAEAVLGQDATRAMDQDNNAIPVDVKQGLVFKAGDVVFIDLNLKDFTASLSAAASIPGVTALPNVPANKSYTLKITLGA